MLPHTDTKPQSSDDGMKSVLDLFDQKACKWLFYGDSITHGAKHTAGHRDYTQLFSEKVRYELDRRGDIVINTAFSGNTTRDLLGDFDWRVGQFSPTAVFVMIGMNDCDSCKVPLDEFQENLSLLVRRIVEIGALPVMQTTNPIVTGQAPSREPHFPAYMNAVRETAEKNALPLIDHTTHWMAQSSFPTSWMADAFHPNAQGHHALYEHLWNSIVCAAQGSSQIVS